MNEVNDSFEDEPVTKNEMIQCGRNIGASHVLICYDTDQTYVSYVMPHEDVDSKVERCEGGCASVEVVEISDPR